MQPPLPPAAGTDVPLKKTESATAKVDCRRAMMQPPVSEAQLVRRTPDSVAEENQTSETAPPWLMPRLSKRLKARDGRLRTAAAQTPRLEQPLTLTPVSARLELFQAANPPPFTAVQPATTEL